MLPDTFQVLTCASRRARLNRHSPATNLFQSDYDEYFIPQLPFPDTLLIFQAQQKQINMPKNKGKVYYPFRSDSLMPRTLTQSQP